MKQIVIVLLVFSFIFSATGMVSVHAQDDGFSVEAVRNMVYPTDYGYVALQDGAYQAKTADGTEFRLTLYDVIPTGDLNNDGAVDAAVLLMSTEGSTSVYYNLYPVLNRNGKPAAMAPTFIGDRIIPKNFEVVNGTIFLSFLTQGENDNMCCPTQEVSRSYTLTYGLVEGPGLPIDRPDALSFDGTTLENLTYPLNGLVASVTLINGHAERIDTAGTRTTYFLDETAAGDLNGDGIVDAAVILIEQIEGVGLTSKLYAVLNIDGRYQAVSPRPLGNHITLDSLEIENEVIIVTYTTREKPDQVVRESYRLFPGLSIVESPAVEHDLTYEAISNMSFPIPSGTIDLSGGFAELSGLSYQLGPWLAYGDLNSDGLEDAGVVMSVGQGIETTYLAYIVMNENKAPLAFGPFPLGERININFLRIESSLLLVDLSSLDAGEQSIQRRLTLARQPLDDVMVTHPLTPQMLRNAAYPTNTGQPLQLSEGAGSISDFQGNTTIYQMLPVIVYGDINGDQMEDAAVVLISNQPDGTSVFYEIYAVVNDNGTPLISDPAFMGDRIDLLTVDIRDGLLVTEYRTRDNPALLLRTSYEMARVNLLRVP